MKSWVTGLFQNKKKNEEAARKSVNEYARDFACGGTLAEEQLPGFHQTLLEAGMDAAAFQALVELHRRRDELERQSAGLTDLERAHRTAMDEQEAYDNATQSIIEGRLRGRAAVFEKLQTALKQVEDATRARAALGVMEFEHAALFGVRPTDLDACSLSNGNDSIAHGDPGAPLQYVSNKVLAEQGRRRSDLIRALNVRRQREHERACWAWREARDRGQSTGKSPEFRAAEWKDVVALSLDERRELEPKPELERAWPRAGAA